MFLITNPVVIMCTYARICYLPWTLCCLQSQTKIIPNLFIWNNSYSDKDKVEKIIASHGKDMEINVVHSRNNIGGMGRFYLIKQFNLFSSPVIFLDDDQFVRHNYVEYMIDSYENKSMKGWFAHRFKANYGYWDKIRCKPEEAADYIGTGGMVLDPWLINNEKFWDEFPSKFQAIEDLWLSYWATKKCGYKLSALDNCIMPIIDENATWKNLINEKEEFLSWLRKKRKWNV